MAVEVAVYGLALLWLLALVPAAIVTCLRGEWLMFVAGCLTAGLVWFVGAAPRSRRGIAIVVAGMAAAVVVLGVVAARPVRFLGVDASALQASVGPSAAFGGPDSCEHVGPHEWECGRWDDEGSSVISYRVRVNRFGCWQAVGKGRVSEAARQHRSGCVTLLDYAFA